MKPREKLKALYDLIQERGLFIAPEQDIKFGIEKTINLNIGGTEKIEIAKESYDSVLLFTLLTSIMRNGSMLLFGPPGAGKTTAPEFVGHFVLGVPLDEIQTATIYGHPEQTEEKMVARYDIAELMKGIERIVKREFLQCPVKIIDEVNRLTPGKLSILYQVVDRGFTKYGDELIIAAEGPIFGTANAPDAGNYPLPPPFKDRFDVAVVANELNPFYIDFLLERNDEKLNGNIEELLQIPAELKLPEAELKGIRQEIKEIGFDSATMYQLIHFISETNYCGEAGEAVEDKTKAQALNKKPGALCGDCHYKAQLCAMTENGISPRTYKAIVSYAKALAWWRGKEKVELEDLEQILPFMLWHKLIPTKKAFEADAVFVNDRKAMVRYLFNASKKNYLQAKQVINDYDAMLATVEKLYDGEGNKEQIEAEILSQLSSLQNIDSVIKYPIAVTLANIYKAVRK